MAGDISAYGVSAMISQVFPNGTEHPVAFALPFGSRQPSDVSSAFMIGQVQALPVTTEYLETLTRQDLFLSQIYHYI